MVRRTLDVLSVLAVLVVMVIIMYASSSLIDGRFYEEDVHTSWEEITESFYRWEYSEKAKVQQVSGEAEFDGDDVSILAISNVSGPVTVIGWDRDYYRVEFDRSGVDKQFLQDVYAEVVKKNSRLDVSTHYRPNVPGVSGHVAYTINIPETLSEVVINTISGSVRLESIPKNTALTVTMVSSEVYVRGGEALRVRGYSGNVDFSLSGGSIKIDVSSASVRGTFQQFLEGQSISVRTSGGSIDLLFPRDLDNVSYAVKANQGSIYLSPTLSEFKKAGPVNEATGVIGTPNHSITLESSGGNINLRLDGDEDEMMSIEQLEVDDPEEVP